MFNRTSMAPLLSTLPTVSSNAVLAFLCDYVLSFTLLCMSHEFLLCFFIFAQVKFVQYIIPADFNPFVFLKQFML